MSNIELWNIKNLQAPPLTTYKSSLIDIIPLRNHFLNAVEYFENLNILEQEAALLSRCIYRMKTKLRTDKGLKSMEKLNRVLLQFNYLNMPTVLKDFMSLLPEDEGSELYLPSKNMLDYVLIRLQGVACLMHRAVETAHIAASFMGSRICIGHLWKVALIVLGVVSRIWFICKDILKCCCDFYKNIKSVRNLLKNTGNNWLPDQYNLPECLETWLCIDWEALKEKSISYHVDPKIPFFDLVDSSDVEECGNYIEIKDNVDDVIYLSDNDKLKDDENMTKLDTFHRLLRNNDLGEVVSLSKKQNNKVISLSSDSEDDYIQDTETNRDKSKQIFGIDGKLEKLNESENINPNNKKKRIGHTTVRDDVSDIIDISDNDNLESTEEATKLNAFKQAKGSDTIHQVVTSTLLHIRENMNVINLSGDSEDNAISGAHTEIDQSDIGNTNSKKKRKKKSKLSKKQNKLETTDVEQITSFKKEETMVETTLKQSIKTDKMNINFIQIINNLNSIKKLKNFMSNLEDFNTLAGSHKVDKLQLVMLRKVIKKYTHSAKTKLISTSECLLKAKKVLKVTFIK